MFLKPFFYYCNIDQERREREVKETEVEKPIECGKSFHLITQRDHKLTDKRPRKRACWKNCPQSKCICSASVCHWIFSSIRYTKYVFSGHYSCTSTALMEWFMWFDCKYQFECDQTRLCRIFYIFCKVLYFVHLEWGWKCKLFCVVKLLTFSILALK